MHKITIPLKKNQDRRQRVVFFFYLELPLRGENKKKKNYTRGCSY